jgi:E3 ubiquitin-protein ligase HECTD1
MKTALENLIVLLKDENTISPYEMCSSGLVQALLTVLNNVSIFRATKQKQNEVPKVILSVVSHETF